MATVFNNEFRDKAASSAFPFTSDSLMSYSRVVIDTACFLDASIYPLSIRKAPYHISELDISGDTEQSLKVTIRDSVDTMVGTVLCDPDLESAVIHDEYDCVIGVLVYTPDKIKELIGALGRAPLKLPESILRFTAGTCYATESSGNRMFLAGGKKFQEDIVIAAAGGVHFEQESPPVPYNSSSSSSSSQSSSSPSSPTSESSSKSSSSSSSSSRSSLSSSSITSVSSTSSSESPLNTSSSSSLSSSSFSSLSSSSPSSASSESSSDSAPAHGGPYVWDTTDATVAHWKCNETSGYELVDNVGGYNMAGYAECYYQADCDAHPDHYTLLLSKMSTPGKIGLAVEPYVKHITIYWDCGGDDYGREVDPPADVVIDTKDQIDAALADVFTKPFSICGWVRINDLNGYYGYPQLLFKVGMVRFPLPYASDSRAYITLKARADGSLEFVYRAQQGQPICNAVSDPYIPNDGEFHHIAVNVTRKRVDMYIDGIRATTGLGDVMEPIDMSLMDVRNGGEGTRCRFFNNLLDVKEDYSGKVIAYDDLRIHNRALTHDEIGGIYNYGSGTEETASKESSSSEASYPVWDFTPFTSDYFTCDTRVDVSPTEAYIPNDMPGASRKCYIYDPGTQPLVPGILDNAITMPCTVSGNYADNLLDFSLREPFTVSCWVYLTEMPDDNTKILGLQRTRLEDARSYFNEFGVRITTGSSFNKLELRYEVPEITDTNDPLYGSEYRLIVETAGAPLSIHRWSLITVSFDGTFKLTVDNEDIDLDIVRGGPVSSAMMDTFQDEVPYGHDNDLTRGLGVGAWSRAVIDNRTGGTLSEMSLLGPYPPGSVDDIRLMSGVLSSFDIGILWNNGNGIAGLEGGGPPDTSSNSSSSEAPYSTVSSSSSSSSNSSSSEGGHSLMSSSSSSTSSTSNSSTSISSSSSNSSSDSFSFSSSSSTFSSLSSSTSSSSFSSSSSWEARHGTVSVNLYGEMYTLDAPIVSINGREMDNVWLSAHPEAAVRVVTDSDEKIIIGKAKEFNNG